MTIANGILDASAMRDLGALIRADGYVPVLPASKPSGFQWGDAYIPDPQISVVERNGLRLASIGGFDPLVNDPTLAAALASGVRYWISSSGSDSNDGSFASPWSTVSKAQQAINASASGGVIEAIGGQTLNRTRFALNTTQPSKPTIFRANGGRVRTTTWDTGLTFVADGTYTRAYKVSAVAAARVFNPSLRSLFGYKVGYISVSSIELCHLLAGSFYTDGTDTWVHPHDNGAPVDANCQVFRRVNSAYVFNSTTPVSVYFCGDDGSSGWDVEGGLKGAFAFSVNAVTAAAMSGGVLIGAKNSTFRYSGSVGDATPSGVVEINNQPGLIYLDGCDVGSGLNDLISKHQNSIPGRKSRLLALNTTASDASGAASVNAFTDHEDGEMIVAGGLGRATTGGTVGIVDTARAWAVGATFRGSIGDEHISGGVFRPYEVGVADAAEVWLDRCDLVPDNAGARSLWARTSGSKIHLRNTYAPYGLRTAVAGATIDAY